MKPTQLLFALLAAWAVVAVLMSAAADAAADAATCNGLPALSPCAGAIIGNAAPIPTCCKTIKEQEPCLCQYARDPKLQRYVNSPNAKKVMGACMVPLPSC